jgi:hypothetical protein
MTQIITKAWDELLYQLIDLTNCDVVDWCPEPWVSGYCIANQKVWCNIRPHWLLGCAFTFEGWKRKAWNKDDPVKLLYDAVIKQQHRKEVESHKRRMEDRVQKKEQIMGLKCGADK